MSDTPTPSSRTTRETQCALCGAAPGLSRMSCVCGRGDRVTSPAYVGLRALAEQAPPSHMLTMADIARTLSQLEAEPARPERRVLGRIELSDGRRVYVVLEACTEGGYTVCLPGLPGCVTEGETVEEALANAREAAELWLASR